jgi:hypothetical protein
MPCWNCVDMLALSFIGCTGFEARCGGHLPSALPHRVP